MDKEETMEVATMELDQNEIESNSLDENEKEELKFQIKEAESQLVENEYLYDPYIELIDLYEKVGDSYSLLKAFRRLHEHYPLTSELWLKWINIEKKNATSDKQKQHILTLFDKSLSDYLSIQLRLEYAQYTMEVTGLESAKELCEKLLASAGLHVKDGSLLWDFLRELELASLSTCPKDSDAWKQQAERVVDVFRRQLSVPLYDMEETFKEWKIWKETLPESVKLDDESLERGYHKALNLLESYRPYEEELAAAKDDSESYWIYKKYITSVKEPATVMCLYERALAELCLNSVLWLDYCNYVFKFGEVSLSVCLRALRNCPCNVELWVLKLRNLENLNRTVKQVSTVFEEGLFFIDTCESLQFWFAYVDYLVRKSKDTELLFKVLAQASKCVGPLDASIALERLRARLLAKNGELKQAISVWNNIMEIPVNKQMLALWLEFIAMLKQFGDVNQVRSLYQRAMNASQYWEYYFAGEWLLFEREHGTLDDVMLCSEKLKAIVAKAQKPQQYVYNPGSTVWQYFPQQVQYPNNGKQPLNNTDSMEFDSKGEKRKHAPELKKDFKKVKEDVEQINKEVKKISIKKPILKDPTRTVFISNIGLKVDEETLSKMFPNAENIDICRDKKEKSRGFGFIQFRLEEEVMTALARDREPLDGRPVYISNCKPDKNERKPVFKYSSGVEENKLFVRGLPKSLTEEEVMDIFKPHGAEYTRLLMFREGKSRGLAYVEFPDAESAKKAIEATDQMVVGERTITVAVSDPSQKKADDEKVTEPVRHARSRLQVPLIPRSLQVKSENDKGLIENGASKSNEDFRKMLE